LPLTQFQAKLAKLLAVNRSNESHLAGGAALHIQPNSIRYSNDLDYFNDSDERVADAYEQDSLLLKQNGYLLEIEIRQPGYIRAIVSKSQESTKVEWAHDSAWRFMPAIKSDACGYQLHPIDLAVNKVLTLAGRNEARDFIDVIFIHENILPLGALCWAASGKDPGFNPRSLLELLKRRGRFQQSDFDRLHLKSPVDLGVLKEKWLAMIDGAEAFISSRPATEVGALYLSKKDQSFFAPRAQDPYELHYGRPGGILPIFSD